MIYLTNIVAGIEQRTAFSPGVNRAGKRMLAVLGYHGASDQAKVEEELAVFRFTIIDRVLALCYSRSCKKGGGV